MSALKELSSDFCVFEYLYRDGGNWKTLGSLLLRGPLIDSRQFLEASCESDLLFVAEQVGVPSLCARHWEDCGDGPSDIDHAYHEFVDLRPANVVERATLPVTGSLEELLARFRRASGRWDVSLSPNCYL